MLFEVDTFLRMKKGHIKWNANVSFHFRKDTNIANKLSLIWFYRFLFFINKLKLLRLTTCYDTRHPENNIYLFCQELREILQSWAFVRGYHLPPRHHQHPKFPVFPRVHYFGWRWHWCSLLMFLTPISFILGCWDVDVETDVLFGWVIGT